MKQSGQILIVDDEVNMLRSLSNVFDNRGYKVATAQDGGAALKIMDEGEFNIVFTDLKMAGMDGVELLERIKKDYPETDVVIFTAYGSIQNAVTAMKKGAWDYIVKPFDPEEVLLIAEKILEHQNLVRENVYLQEEISKDYRFENIIGRHPRMQQIYEIIRQISGTNANVLIFGESGTGKELIAQAIHYNSPRRSKPFVKVSCAALSDGIIESELFGHEKGAFTNAYTRKKGRFELADEGTLFLDEVGEISPATQVKLLRVLQEREFERVGGTKTIQVDVRLISATNQDLQRAIRQNRFREDLYYRLNVIPISIPPLRERREDIPLLAMEFLKKYALEMNKKVERISKKTMQLLIDYEWPGNVRELENVIERAVVMSNTSTLDFDTMWIRPPYGSSAEAKGMGNSTKSLYAVEKNLILEVLEESDWNVARAARILEIARGTLYSKIQKYGLNSPDYRSKAAHN